MIPEAYTYYLIAASGLIMMTLGAFAVWRVTKSVKETAQHVSSIHTAVNNERETMMRLVGDLRDEIIKITRENATLTERLAHPPDRS